MGHSILRSIFVVVIVGFGVVVNSIISVCPTDGAEKQIVIGGSIPLSGAEAETGRNVYSGYQVAVKFVNEQYGGVKVQGATYKLKLDMFDDATDPSKATTLIQRQLDEGVDFFLGSFSSSIVLPTCSMTERVKKPMVQAGGGSDLIFTQGRKFVFGMFPRASRQFYTFRDFFKRLGKVKTFTIVYLNTPYNKFMSDGAKKSLDEAGFKILQSIELPAQVNDVSGVLASVRGNPPDVLLWFTSDEITMLAAKQMVTTNTYVKMLFFSLGPYTVAFRETFGKRANEIISQVYWDEGAAYKGSIFGSAKEFANYYREHFTRPMVPHTAAGAACIVAYVHAIQNANSLEPVKVRDALAALDLMTFYGRLKFTQDGDAVAEFLGPLVAQVQKGKVEVLYPSEAATAEPIFPMTPWEKR